MPVTPQYSWEETPSSVRIRVEFKAGFSRKDLDILVTSCHVRLSLPPYLLSLDLAHSIHPSSLPSSSSSSATCGASGVTIVLTKEREGLWGRLTYEGEKEEGRRRRERSVEEYSERIRKADEEKRKEKRDEERRALDMQMKLEHDHRNLIEQRKAAELKREQEEVYSWQRTSAPIPSQSQSQSDASTQPAPEPADDGPGTLDGGYISPVRGGVQIWDLQEEEEEGEEVRGNPGTEKFPEEKDLRRDECKSVPALRHTHVVTVTFTNTAQPNVPARQSRVVDLAASKPKGGPDDDADTADISDRAPAFLKDKGDEFYRRGDYKSAVNAYTRALARDPNHAACYSNRAACQLRLGRPADCIQDCTAAIHILQPSCVIEERSVDENDNIPQDVHTRALARAYARRGRARAETMDETEEGVKEAIGDYEKAMKLLPEDEGLKRDVQELRDCLHLPDAEEWKRRGGDCFAREDVHGACEAYTRAVESSNCSLQTRLLCLSNRAACFIKFSDFASAVSDCTAALSTMDTTTTTTSSSSLSKKLFARRAAAYAHLKEYAAAQRDYQRAISMLEVGKVRRDDVDVALLESLKRDMAVVSQLSAA